MAKITAKVMKTIRFRSGNAWPAGLLTASGSASAAASERAPRIPLQPTSSRSLGPMRRATWLGRRSSSRIRYGTVNPQAIRVAITTALASAACPSRLAAE